MAGSGAPTPSILSRVHPTTEIMLICAIPMTRITEGMPQELENAADLSKLVGIQYHRVLDNALIELDAESLWLQLNYQLIHLLDFLPSANWVRACKPRLTLTFPNSFPVCFRISLCLRICSLCCLRLSVSFSKKKRLFKNGTALAYITGRAGLSVQCSVC